MAKKVRFPLEMEDGVEVRSMEELRDNFSLSRVLEYFNDGRLVHGFRTGMKILLQKKSQQLIQTKKMLKRKFVKF